MRHTLPTKVLVVLVCVLALGGLAACGSGGKPTDASSIAQAPESVDTPDPGRDSDETSLPEEACSVLTAAEVGAAIGGAVSLVTGPSGDCEFSQEDPRGLSGSLGFVDEADTNGGYDGYLAGVAASLTDPVRRDIADLGSAASTFVGLPAFGGSENLMAGGVVDRGSFLEQTTLAQGQQMSAEDLDRIAEALLRLLDSKLA
ncbi:hypothetical protein [Nocardioides sp.]|uniref:hypothetical protein n=1 Tax=Nocardioides sp. TaxID=35761 RepID=UPI00356136F1